MDVSSDANEALPAGLMQSRGYTNMARKVELGETNEILPGELPLMAEETEVTGVRTETRKVIGQAPFVIGSNGANVDCFAVMQNFIGRITASLVLFSDDNCRHRIFLRHPAASLPAELTFPLFGDHLG